jgi:hypothetical protein
VAILPITHDGQGGFDNIHIGEEIDLEDFVHKADGSTALCQLLDSSDHG